MRIRYGIAALAAGVLSGVYETAVWGFAPGAAAGVHPAVPGIALLILYEQPMAALLFAAAAGLVSDLFAVDASSFLLGGYVCIALLLALMSRTVFTNRSLYAAIALCAVGRIGENLWHAAANAFQGGSWLAGMTLVTASPRWAVPAWDAAIMGITFAVGLFVRRRLGGRRNGPVRMGPTRYG